MLESAGYVICSFSRYRHTTECLYQISSYLNNDFDLWPESRFHLLSINKMDQIEMGLSDLV